MNPFRRIKKWYQGLPDKKRYLEVVTAFLSIPVLLTVILNNVGNIQERKKIEKNTGGSTKEKGGVTVIPIEIKTEQKEVDEGSKKTDDEHKSTTPTSCKKDVGPVEILSPREEETITDDPVCIDVSHETGEYCAVVWSYRIDGSSWSDFTDKAICLYNLESGEKNLELRVKSIASGDEKILKRSFTYESDETNPTPSITTTPTPTV